MVYSSFKELLFENFLLFQREVGKHSLTAFALFLSDANTLGVKFSQPLVSSWLNGDYKPSEKYAPALAQIYGPGVYDLLDIERPNPLYEYVTRHWNELPNSEQVRIGELISSYTSDPVPNANKPEPSEP